MDFIVRHAARAGWSAGAVIVAEIGENKVAVVAFGSRPRQHLAHAERRVVDLPEPGLGAASRVHRDPCRSLCHSRGPCLGQGCNTATVFAVRMPRATRFPEKARPVGDAELVKPVAASRHLGQEDLGVVVREQLGGDVRPPVDDQDGEVVEKFPKLCLENANQYVRSMGRRGMGMSGPTTR